MQNRVILKQFIFENDKDWDACSNNEILGLQIFQFVFID